MFNLSNTMLYFIIPLIALILPFILSFTFHFIKMYAYDKRRFIPSEFGDIVERRKLVKKNFFKRLLWDFPKRFWLDRFNSNPDKFPHFGLHIVCGEQGSGKSITCVYLMKQWKTLYPALHVRTNCFYTDEDEHLNSLDDIFDNTNGIYGHVDYFSEIQQQFNSTNHKNISPELVGQVCMQRKQYKVILGDAQVFTRVAKSLREQTFYLYEPITVAGCLTIVRMYRPLIGEDGKCEKKRLVKMFFFVQDDDLRNSYDTREVIEHLSNQTFKPFNEQLGAEWQTNIKIEK